MTDKTALTADQARLLRSADTLCFEHTQEGEGFIRANMSIGAAPTDEIVARVPVESSQVNNYGDRWDGPWRCFAMLMSPQYTPKDQTLLRHFRAGSQVGLIWTRHNNSPALEEAGLNMDMLEVAVQTKAGIVNTFRIATSIGPDSPFAMIVRAHNPASR